MRKTGKVACKIAGAVFAVNVIAFAADFNIQAANTYVTEGTSDTENDENTYTIQYELNGGTNNEENPSSYTAGEGVASLKLATKFEHNFEGWYLDAALQNKVEGISEDISGDVILYAKWSLYNYDHTIYYNTHYGYNGEHNPSGYYEGVGVSKLEDAYRRGYSFGGWYITDEKNPFTKQITSIDANSSGDMYIEAKFTPNVYQIIYEMGDGELPEDAVCEYTYGVGLTSFPEPALETQRFQGWYEDMEYTKPVTSIGKDTIDDITLYAKWKDAEAESIVLSTNNLSVHQDSTAQLSVTEILPEDTVDKQVTYRSANDKIASIDSQGKIIGITPGNTVVYAKVGQVEASCKVTVLPYTVSFAMSKYNVKTTKTVATRIKLESGDSVKSYTSSNRKIATVNKKGVVKGVKAGTVKITVETVKGAKAVCTVKVTKNVVKTKKITVNKSKVVLKKNATFKIKAKIQPSDSTEGIKYKSSNKKVATVTSKGVIKGKRKGNCIITVTSGTKLKKIRVTVK
jgi:uncharacterized repeat protein (TIGR02543 family)